METWLLIDDLDNAIIDRCIASSRKSAQSIFDKRGYMIGDVLSEADYLNELQQNNMECSLEM